MGGWGRGGINWVLDASGFSWLFGGAGGTLHGMWDLSSLTRVKPMPPALEAWSLNLWTTWEVPKGVSWAGAGWLVRLQALEVSWRVGSGPQPEPARHSATCVPTAGSTFLWHPQPVSPPSHLPSQGTFIPSSVITCSFPEPHLAFLVTNITVQLQKSCTMHILRGVCVSSGSATALGPLSVKILVRDSPGAVRNLGPQPTLSRNLPLQMT